jgi:hypothetical protein
VAGQTTSFAKAISYRRPFLFNATNATEITTTDGGQIFIQGEDLVPKGVNDGGLGVSNVTITGVLCNDICFIFFEVSFLFF